jgi:hypothetical protein
MLEVWLGVVDPLQAAALSLPLNFFKLKPSLLWTGKKGGCSHMKFDIVRHT